MAQMSLEQMGNRMGDFIREFPNNRRGLMVDVGQLLESEVRENVGAIKEHTGNLKKAITTTVASGGGYVSVKNNHSIAPHGHLIENGHYVSISRKSNDGSGTRTKEHKETFVPGKFMYQNALDNCEDEILRKAESMIADSLRDMFE